MSTFGPGHNPHFTFLTLELQAMDTIHPQEADHHPEVDRHGANNIGTGIELKESPEWTESKEHTLKTFERSL